MGGVREGGNRCVTMNKESRSVATCSVLCECKLVITVCMRGVYKHVHWNAPICHFRLYSATWYGSQCVHNVCVWSMGGGGQGVRERCDPEERGGYPVIMKLKVAV